MRLRLAFAFSLLPGLLSMSASSASAAAPLPELGSTVFDWAKLSARPTPVGERRDVVNQPTRTLARFESHITTLLPGKASHEPHCHPQEELILLKEGRLEVHLNGQTHEVGPGSVLFFASNDAHAVRNVGSGPATYWVINLTTPDTLRPEAHNRAPTRPSGVFDWEKLTVTASKTGERRQVLSGSTVTMAGLTCHVTTLNPLLAAHPAHIHPDEEIVIVKEGTMEATFGGKSQPAGAGSIFFFASNDLHGMRNVANARASYYVIRFITSATPKVAAK
jgi:quercetin dioxygenase-like cupin family protein